MRRLGAFKSAAAGLLILALFCSAAVAQRDPVLPDAPLTKDMLDAGIPLPPNLHRVTNNLYRSALARDRNQLLNAVKYYRLRTVVDLKTTRSDLFLITGREVTLRKAPIRLSPFQPISRAQVVGALAELDRALKAGATLVHCQDGADRTGMIVAFYRILYERWTKQQALAELRDPKFGFHNWRNIIDFINHVNVEALRRDVEAAA